jgi:hypothetical protein
VWRTTPKKIQNPPYQESNNELQLEEEEEMEGADSDADGNTNATYEVLTTTRAIYSEKNSGNNSQKNQQQKLRPPRSRRIFTEGLGSVIGLQRARKQSMEDYITVVLLWLHQGELTIANPRNC